MIRLTVTHQSRPAIMANIATAPEGSRISIGPPIKSRGQEERFHAMLNEIAQQASYLGSKWTAEDWKRLMVDAWAKEESGMPRGRVIPALGGDGIVQLGIQTRSLSKERYSSLIEFTQAWCAMNGVLLKDGK